MQLLLVDDEPTQRKMLAEYLAERGHEVAQAGAAEEALGRLQQDAHEVVLTDVRLPGADGVELIRQARRLGTRAEFLVMTAFGTLDNAVEAMRAGAYDYLTKPISLDDLDDALARIRDHEPAPPPEVRLPAADPFAGLGAAMQRVSALIDRIAPSEATVLIRGESGCGKEVVADQLHARSRRADGPFIKINCAALPDALLEAELFGYAKGAFTGADQARRGHFEAAARGTLLLDEIGDISPALQVRLLRVLQEREVTPLGTSRAVPIDCRLVTATHRDLDARVREGRFREDLLYRLRVVELEVAPLRDRLEDIPLLAERLIARHARRNRVAAKPLDTTALGALSRFAWPGNVRQLEHVLERALVLAADDTITAVDLPREITGTEPAAAPRTLREAVEALERTWIRRAMDACGDVRARAARSLGIPERVLRYKLRKYDLDPKGRK